MLISVIVTSYNYDKYIKETINSVVSQTFEDWELIIVDDASQDGSAEIIKKAAENDGRIKIIFNDKNLGLKASLQKALELAGGEWAAFLESDDLWDKNYLAEKAEIIAKYSDTGVIFNDVELAGSTEKVQNLLKSNRKFLRSKTYPCNMFFDLNLRNRIVTFSSVMIKKNLLCCINWQTPSDRLLDWWIYIQIAYDNKFYYIDKKLTVWRIHRDSYINRKHAPNGVMTNVCSMIEVFKKEPSLKLLLYILYTVPVFAVMKLWKRFFAKNL